MTGKWWWMNMKGSDLVKDVFVIMILVKSLDYLSVQISNSAITANRFLNINLPL